jgi:hypothetical protein
MVTCPKCGSSNAWYSKDRVDVTLRCLCGYYRVVQTLLDQIDTKLEVTLTKLPIESSNLYKTLMVLFYLGESGSQQIAYRMNSGLESFKYKDVLSYLYVLKSKGFVMQVQTRKGVAGGTIWKITEEALELIEKEE